MLYKYLFLLLLTYSITNSVYAQKLIPINSFGDNGTSQKTVYNDYAYARYALVQPDGKVLVCITSTDEFGYGIQQLIYRFNPNGALDESFGNSGILELGYGDGYGVIRGGYFDLQPDGKIVAANLNVDRNGELPDRLIIERFLPSGTRDSSFAKTGVIVYEAKDDAPLSVLGIKVKPNGKILVAGGINYATTIGQFDTFGHYDKSFGDNGMLQSKSAYDQNIRQLLVLPDNRFVTANIYFDQQRNSYSSCLVAYKANGNIDSSAGVNGIILNDNALSNSDVSIGLCLQDNKILEYTADNTNSLLLRFDQHGNMDNSFGENGKLITGAFDRYSDSRFPHFIGVQNNQRIIVSIFNNLARYYSNGKPDSSFGINAIFQLPALNYSMVFTINKDKLYASGTTAGDYPVLIVNAYRFCFFCGTTNTANEVNNSISGNVKSGNIKLFPNPVKGQLYVSGLSSHITSQLQLTDGLGHIVKTATTQSPTYQWNLQGLPAGIYFVKIVNEEKSYSFKILKE